MNKELLRTHKPMEFVISDWLGKKTVIGAIYEVIEGESLKYRIVNIYGDTQTIAENEIISVVKCSIERQAEVNLIALSKLYEEQLYEQRKYAAKQKELEKSIAYATKRLNSATERKLSASEILSILYESHQKQKQR